MRQPVTTFGIVILGVAAVPVFYGLIGLSCQPNNPPQNYPVPRREPVLEPLSVYVPTPVEMTPPRELVAPDDDYMKRVLLFYAIARAEGWKGIDTPGSDGERGKYQVTPRWWKDCNRITGEDLPFTPSYYLQDTLVESRMILYWFRYGAKTNEEKARAHNGGGPNGMTMKATLEYWKKVKKHLPKEMR